MINVSPKHRVFLAIEPIDFRNGIDGLVRYCHKQFHQDPLQGHYFIFRNRRKTSIKLLYYDSQGFCLFQKRLSTGRFRHWPTVEHRIVHLTPAQFQVLLYNGDPNKTDEAAPWAQLT